MADAQHLRYELLILTIPEITQDESEKLHGQVAKIITQAEGKVISWDRWGKYLLAYPVNDYEYGVYFLMRFDVPKAAAAKVVDEIRHTFRVRFTQVVMRHMFQQLGSEVSLDYQRPESLEDKPQRDVSTFLKENKMTGLVETPDRHAAKKASGETGETQSTESEAESTQDESQESNTQSEG